MNPSLRIITLTHTHTDRSWKAKIKQTNWWGSKTTDRKDMESELELPAGLVKRSYVRTNIYILFL